MHAHTKFVDFSVGFFDQFDNRADVKKLRSGWIFKHIVTLVGMLQKSTFAKEFNDFSFLGSNGSFELGIHSCVRLAPRATGWCCKKNHRLVFT